MQTDTAMQTQCNLSMSDVNATEQIHVVENYYAGYCFSSSSLNQDWVEIIRNIHVTDILKANTDFYYISSLIDSQM